MEFAVWLKQNNWFYKHDCWHDCWCFKRKKVFSFKTTTIMLTIMIAKLLVSLQPNCKFYVLAS